MDERTYNLNQSKVVRKYLRNNSTQQETKLWEKLKGKQLGYKFRRQHSIGNYVVDFYCPKNKLVVEIDGIQHKENKDYDDERTDSFKVLGIKVLRFWNHKIDQSLEDVLLKIQKELE